MKKIKAYIQILFKLSLVGLLLAPVSCSDFLDKPLQGQLTQDSFPVTDADALQATNAIYYTLRTASYNSGTYPILDIMSDDARKGSNTTDQASTIGPYDSFTNIATEGTLDQWWSTLYEGIKRANVVLQKVPLISMDETLKNRYVGEASFLRALFYFDLVRAWGDVPRVDALEPSPNLPRTPKAEIYSLIISDLSAAIQSLPEKSDLAAIDLGRATKGAAKSLLAKVYLFQGDYVNTEKYALEVINSGQYSLMPNFADANSKTGEFGAESIFEIGSIGADDIKNGGNQYANTQGVRGVPNRGWGFNRPSIDLMNAFEPNDPRKDLTIIYLNEVIDGITILGDGSTPDETKDENGNLIEVECYNQKVWVPGVDVPSQFDHNRRILRYADVLLMAAEALNKNGKSSDALPYLNMIRQRARGADNTILLDIAETNQDALQELILKERRVELALEGHRFWDLVRTNKAETVLGPSGFIKGKNELLPIPQTELDLTGNKWETNPGWK